MAEPPPRSPFDPLKGAFILLLVMAVGLVLYAEGMQIGCILGVQALCDRTGENVREVAMELITAVAVLIAVGRRGNGGDS